jgi:hypothetical protein
VDCPSVLGRDPYQPQHGPSPRVRLDPRAVWLGGAVGHLRAYEGHRGDQSGQSLAVRDLPPLWFARQCALRCPLLYPHRPGARLAQHAQWAHHRLSGTGRAPTGDVVRPRLGDRPRRSGLAAR